MKSGAIITMALMVLVSAFYLVLWSGLSDAWAKKSGGQSSVSAPATTAPANTGASQSTASQAKKKKKTSSDQQEYMKLELKDALISN
jgi:hypothetical protein